jgi:hypothetical protein
MLTTSGFQIERISNLGDVLLSSKGWVSFREKISLFPEGSCFRFYELLKLISNSDMYVASPKYRIIKDRDTRVCSSGFSSLDKAFSPETSKTGSREPPYSIRELEQASDTLTVQDSISSGLQPLMVITYNGDFYVPYNERDLHFWYSY